MTRKTEKAIRAAFNASEMASESASFLTVELWELRQAEASSGKRKEPGSNYLPRLRKCARKMSAGWWDAVARHLGINSQDDARAFLRSFAQHPRTGETAAIYSIEKTVDIASTLGGDTLALSRLDSHTLTHLANMSRFGFEMTVPEMCAVDGALASDVKKEIKSLAYPKARIVGSYGAGTIATQACSTGQALATFGLAEYTGHMLRVRESDKILRNVCAKLDSLSDAELCELLAASRRASWSPDYKGCAIVTPKAAQ